MAHDKISLGQLLALLFPALLSPDVRQTAKAPTLQMDWV